MKQYQYTAHLVDNGRILKSMPFTVTDPEKAYAEANDGIDPLSGQWVDCRPVPKKKNKVNNDENE